MDPVDIMLEEYRTLRQESLDAMKNRNTILSFGLAVIGAVFTGSIVAHRNDAYSPASDFSLILMIPAISILVLLMWLGEYERSQRAGEFLATLERRINEETSRGGLLSWETTLRHMTYPYYATVLLLIILSCISLATGVALARFSTTWMRVAIHVAVMLSGVGSYVIVHIRTKGCTDHGKTSC